MSKRHLIIGTAIASFCVTSATYSDTITEKSRNSISTITQEPGNDIKRKVVKTPNGQQIIQESNGNRAVVIQKKLPDGMYSDEKNALLTPGCAERLSETENMLKQHGWHEGEGFTREKLSEEDEAMVDSFDDECFDGTMDLAERMRRRREVMDSSQGANPLRFGPRFAPAQDLKDRMDALRRQ